MLSSGGSRHSGGGTARLGACVAALCAAVAFAAVVTASAGEAPRRGFHAAARPLGPGAWSWFADPRAIHYQGRTYVGWLAPGGDVVIGAHTKTERVRTVLGGNHRTDDHDNPVLLVLPGGRLAAFYSHHDNGPMRYRVSRRPGDITAWSRERIVHSNVFGPPDKGWTYPNPVRLRQEGNRIYLFWRAANWNPAFSTKRPGERWSRARTFIRGPGRPYVKVASNGRDSIYFAFNQGHPRESNTGVYFAKYRDRSFFRADGTRIAMKRSLPFAPAQADIVYQPLPGRPDAWVHDVAIGPRRRPVIVYAVFPSPRRHVYKYSRWTGRRWVTHTITPAGGPITPDYRERFYSGGLTLHHGDPSVVYLSRKVGPVHEVERWRTRNGGRSWSHRPITSHSPVPNVRPVRPRGLPRGEEEVIWMRGHYHEVHLGSDGRDDRACGARSEAAGRRLPCDPRRAPRGSCAPPRADNPRLPRVSHRFRQVGLRRRHLWRGEAGSAPLCPARPLLPEAHGRGRRREAGRPGSRGRGAVAGRPGAD